MSDDWAVGDLALCVDKVPCDDGLEVGRIYRVESTQIVFGIPGLNVEGLPPVAWRASLFRKIRPDAHEGSADDWALILETTKRKAKA